MVTEKFHRIPRKTPAILVAQKLSPEGVLLKSVLKDFAKFRGKHL